MSVVERVRALVEPILVEDGLELYDVEYGGGRVVVLADRPGGIDLDALTRATQRISAAFDRADPVPGGHYVLEVSSPGLERRLRTPAHFRRYVGSTISVKTLPGVEGERRCQGVLTAADGEGFTVDDRRFAYADVERVRTVFEWGPPPRPGRAKAPKRAAARGPAAEGPAANGAEVTSTRPSGPPALTSEPRRHSPRDQKAHAS